MTLDNDHAPIAPRFPSDAPPRRGGLDSSAQTAAEGVAAPAATMAPASTSKSTDGRDDATTARAIVRAILAALPLDARAAVIAATLAWCRTLATVAAMVERNELGAGEALPLTEAATVTLIERPESPPHDPVCAILGAWWAAGPYDLARQVSRGTTFAGDFVDAIAFLVQLAGEGLAPPSPRILRLPFDGPRGGAPITREALDALTRDAARELSAVDPNNDRGAEVGGLVRDAQRAALDVHAGEGPGCSASALAALGAALVQLAARESLEVEGPDVALRYSDHCANVRALVQIAARAYDAARAVCDEAVARGDERVSDTRWPKA